MPMPKNITSYHEDEQLTLKAATEKWIEIDLGDRSKAIHLRHRVYALIKVVRELYYKKVNLSEDRQAQPPYNHWLMNYAKEIDQLTTTLKGTKLCIGRGDAPDRPKNATATALSSYLNEHPEIRKLADKSEMKKLAEISITPEEKIQRELAAQDALITYKSQGSKPELEKEIEEALQSMEEFERERDALKENFGIKKKTSSMVMNDEEREAASMTAERGRSLPTDPSNRDEPQDGWQDPEIIKVYPGNAEHRADNYVYFPNGSRLPFEVFKEQLGQLASVRKGEEILKEKIEELQKK